MVQGPTAADLIAGGYLSAPVYYAPPSTVDATRIHSVGGDFNRGEAAAEFDKPKITGDAVQHYTRIAPGAPAVAFCITIEHAKHVASEFRAAGYRADTIDGTLSDWERRDRVASLADGRLHVLTSCEIINEGFDLPVATVAILLRPTQSLGLHLQQIGRVLRPVYAPGAPLETAEDRLAALKSGPKPQAIILDHVGNLHRHGLAEQPRDWSLDGYCEKRQRQLDADVLTIRNRQCPKCYAMHAPAPACPQCGEIYESKREIETVAGELVPLGASAAVRADAWAQCPACQTVHRADLGQCPSCNKNHAKDRRREIGRADTLESLIALGKSRNYKNPYAWASHLMRARGLRAKISNANNGQ
jgi:superfamily II DNA or RNA helicase